MEITHCCLSYGGDILLVNVCHGDKTLLVLCVMEVTYLCIMVTTHFLCCVLWRDVTMDLPKTIQEFNTVKKCIVSVVSQNEIFYL